MNPAVCACCSAQLIWPGWGPAALRVCPDCGSGFLEAEPDLQERYDAGYFDGSGGGGVDYEASKRQFQLINHRRLEHILPLARGLRPKLLELGCATGFFMEAVEERGWQAWGIEISAFAAGKARERFGERVYRGELVGAPADWRGFGLVAAFHVLEHLSDPRADLRRLAARLNPDGLAAFEVPDFGSRKARRQRQAWKYFLPGEHLNYFTRAGLSALLESEGFEVLRFEATSFTRLLGGIDRAGLTGLRSLVLKALPWLAWIKWLVLWFRGLLGGHDCVLVVARRRKGPLSGESAARSGTGRPFGPLSPFIRVAVKGLP